MQRRVLGCVLACAPAVCAFVFLEASARGDGSAPQQAETPPATSGTAPKPLPTPKAPLLTVEPGPVAPPERPIPESVLLNPSAKQKTRDPLPVRLTVVAPSADPPWTMRVENTGEHPIRIAADIRLLSFDVDVFSSTSSMTFKDGVKTEVRTQKVSSVTCRAPDGLRPSKFSDDRELYLQPGQAFVQEFDPRLYCFGDKIDALRGGTRVKAHYGFGTPAPWQTANAFVAQGIDRPEAFAPATQIDAPTMILSWAPAHHESTTPDAVPDEDATVQPANAVPGGHEPPGAREEACKRSKRLSHHKDQVISKHADDPCAEVQLDEAALDAARKAVEKQNAPTFVDLNAGKIELSVDRWADGNSARDVVLTMKTTNEGRRDLVTALRSRMLTFTVEELGADNRPRKISDCGPPQKAHPVSAELIGDLGAGKSASISLLLAEVCPRTVFEHPGLYRVVPKIDPGVDGEGLKLHAYLGKALARQSTLVRIATGKQAFEEDAPRVFVPPPPPVADAEDEDGEKKPAAPETASPSTK